MIRLSTNHCIDLIQGVVYGVPSYFGACVVRRILLGPRPSRSGRTA